VTDPTGPTDAQNAPNLGSSGGADMSRTEQPRAGAGGGAFEAILERFAAVSAGFERRLHATRPEQWSWPTPCSEWDVRALVNHMTRGNLNYALLARGGTGAEFLRLRAVDALSDDPVGAYASSVRRCLAAFSEPGALDRMLDYPMGAIAGRQALAVRTTDSAIHTWDLARATGGDESLGDRHVSWLGAHLEQIYEGLKVGAFFADPVEAPGGSGGAGASMQDALLRRLGREP
jgi:uncharacterized protein (TIGR03086 family)